ncbi:MAG: type II secretion system F family protein [Gammaproteobacteria bacterium]|nr:type II secretion system F family protein [Gammaproteobacteria bacterium]NNL51596.1 type II secretion system F family protein [Woeseiaceae bacterium]
MALQFESEVVEAPAGDKKAGGLNLNLPTGKKRAGAAERMFFTEQLALLLETGESLYGALTAIVKQTENAEMREAVKKIAQDVSEGRSFANALTEHETVFPLTYVNLIAASETGGFMHEVLEQLLKMDEKREQMRTTLVSAATYPLFLIAFSLAVVVFVLVVVFPKFGDMFLSIHDQLPMSTKVLLSTSDVMRQYWIVLLAGLGIFIVAVRHWLHSEAGSARVDYMKLHTPGIRDIFTQIYLVQSLQVLSLSLNNGVSVMESLDACRDVVQNSLFRRLIAKVEESVQSGAGVAAGLADSTFLPDLAKHMIATGEQTGNLGKVAGRICDYYEAQLAKKLDALSKLAEPIMLLVMGVVVGVLVSSLILPIFKLSRAVS